MVGQAWAPMGRKVSQLDVDLHVAEKRKTIRVFGDRHWRNDGSITSTQPFENLPITYERAYGGTHFIKEKQQLLAANKKNIMGKSDRTEPAVDEKLSRLACSTG